MEEHSIVAHLKANRWVTFLILLFVLGVGITIGTLVSTRVGAERPAAEQLKISTSSKPLNVDAPAALSQGFAQIASQVGPAVVYIKTESIVRNDLRSQRQRSDPREFPGFDLSPFFNLPEVQRIQALGSGFIVDSAGFIITNEHVIRGASKIKATLKDGREYTARVIGKDTNTDVAVIKIDGDKPFPFMKIGDSSQIRTGDWVLAIGSPFDLAQSVTAGIISATGRVMQGIGSFNDYLQTDAAINRGNSGGPLINLAGEAVGVNTFISSPSGGSAGVGFAVPSKTFVDIYNQLISGGIVHRGWLGISMNQGPLTPELASYFGVKSGKGVLVTELIDENGSPSRQGPAAKAGILPEDVIVEIDGKQIEIDHDLRTVIATTPPGNKVQIKAVRKGELKTFQVALAERTIDNRQNRGRTVTLDEKEEEPPKPQEIGLTVDNLTSSIARQLQLDSTEGAIVLEVKPGGLAEDAGLTRNDVLIEMNGKSITSAQVFGQLFRSLKSGDAAIVKFIRPPAPGSQDDRKQVFYTSLLKP